MHIWNIEHLLSKLFTFNPFLVMFFFSFSSTGKQPFVYLHSLCEGSHSVGAHTVLGGDGATHVHAMDVHRCHTISV